MRHYLSALILFILSVLPLCAQQHGKASYYSRRATGARTANGERLHHDSLTCAHRYHPFGTMLRVTNLANGLSTVVRVTDRGPYGRSRVIDLSYAAAREIGMVAAGVVSVKVEVVGKQGVPFKPSEEIELPEIDFEVGSAGFSFIDMWRQKGNEPGRMPASAEQSAARKHAETAPARADHGAAKQAAAGGKGVPSAAKSSAAGAHPAKKASTAAQQKHASAHAAKGKQPAAKKVEAGNVWSDVFDRVKGLFDDE